MAFALVYFFPSESTQVQSVCTHDIDFSIFDFSWVEMATVDASTIQWECLPFHALTVTALYDIMQVRARVFVVEQQCIWNEVDGVDKVCWHVVGRAADDSIVAYARLIPALAKGLKQPRPIISRIVVPPEARGGGLGKLLVVKAIEECKKLWPKHVIEIGAQARLEVFYTGLGFRTVSEPYDEDGIMHVDMLYEDV
ncbi:hypothetical protein Ae201684P_018283 [Aphanomyces euteiches]|uniref:N-acetyltransferase domain-containing protein n=1 Tax=Aphanomyces euteiches TaxID=100861 RepID=A0A6G0XVB9_9STRA|nr:hypothetical protein Ae201684_001079 [Aphanomyces euteiches]KAH9099266.1 hypothetical protein Ae201684P_018283 [Aphanomyces euteiches]